MAKTSIKRRLSAAVVLSQMLLAIGLVWAAVYLNHRLLRRAFDTALQGRAMSIAALARYSEELHPRLIFESDMAPPPLGRPYPDLYEILGSDGRIIARSPNWYEGLDALYRQRAPYVEFKFDNVPYRGVQLKDVPVFDREPDVPNNEVITVSYASPTDEMQRQIVMAGIYTAIGSAVLLLISVAVALWGLQRGLRPLADLADSAARVSPADWELRTSEDTLNTAELQPLTHAMTMMLNGLHGAFTQQREFVANAAHELKTPVAILKSTLQSLLQRPRTSDEYRAGLEQALEDMERLERLLHMMLRLARAERRSASGTRDEMEIVDITATCQSAVERLQPLLRERGVSVELSGNGALHINADPEDLRLVWSNLLENAVRFSPPGGQVFLRTRSHNNRGTVEVEDHGPGIPAAELPHIFERFYRGDISRSRQTGGYGLGLAIAKALIEAYGGNITPESAPGKGLRMVISVPLASPDGNHAPGKS